MDDLRRITDVCRLFLNDEVRSMNYFCSMNVNRCPLTLVVMLSSCKLRKSMVELVLRVSYSCVFRIKSSALEV